MRFTELRVERFGPYFAPQEVRFGLAKPIVLIHGDNMRGKTSLLNAIRWALYGKALDRFGQPMALVKLVNSDAGLGGDWTMSVKLGFIVDGVSYAVTRSVQAVDTSVRPTSDSDFEEQLFLQRGNQFVKPADAQTELNRILPEQISRFFLFDGELLKDYEILLADPSKQAQLIKDSIEYILGVPALSNAAKDLGINLKDAGKRQRTLAKKDADAQAYADVAGEIETEIDAMEADLKALHDRSAQLSRTVADLDDALRATALFESDVQRLQQATARAARLESRESQIDQELREKLVLVWRDFVQVATRPRLEAARVERERQVERLQKAGELRGAIAQVEQVARDKVCPTCGHAIDDAQIGGFNTRLAELRGTLDVLGFDEALLSNATRAIASLVAVGPANVISTVRALEREVQGIRVEMADLDQEKRELNDRLAGHDHAAIAVNRRDFIEANKELGAVEGAIHDKQQAIGEKQSEASRYRALIGKVGGPALERLNREVAAYEEMIELFEGALADLRDDRRRSVAQAATDIFLLLTSDKTLKGLQINDYYGLVIINAAGNPVAVRSAGAEQIVALALIGSLNRNAVRRGPIVMDTPFGRLDPIHRENVLAFVPQMAKQVTLLVHGGEVSRERDLRPIDGKIEREYEIRYVSSTRSEIIQIVG